MRLLPPKKGRGGKHDSKIRDYGRRALAGAPFMAPTIKAHRERQAPEPRIAIRNVRTPANARTTHTLRPTATLNARARQNRFNAAPNANPENTALKTGASLIVVVRALTSGAPRDKIRA
jgi:hypothetical protein